MTSLPLLHSEADAATAAAAAAAVAAVKQEATPVKQEAEGAKSGPSEGEQEAQEQLARRDAELAKERAACLKLQRWCPPLSSLDNLVTTISLSRSHLSSWVLVKCVSPGSTAWNLLKVTGRRLDNRVQCRRLSL